MLLLLMLEVIHRSFALSLTLSLTSTIPTLMHPAIIWIKLINVLKSERGAAAYVTARMTPMSRYGTIGPSVKCKRYSPP